MKALIKSLRVRAKILYYQRHKKSAAHAMKAAFEPDFYRFLHPDLAQRDDEALFRHFLKDGWRQGADPHSAFSTNLYQSYHRDVARAGVNPYLHYHLIGKAERRAAFLSQWGSPNGGIAQAEQMGNLLHEADVALLREQLPAEVAALSDQAVVSYFVEKGRDGSLTPKAGFRVLDYLGSNPDVAASGQNGFVHYVQFGRDEGRSLGLTAQSDGAEEEDIRDLMADVEADFDVRHYRAQNSGGEEASDEDLLMHYLTIGWRQRWDPSPQFSTEAYLKAHPDVAQSGICPLVHFARVRDGKLDYEPPIEAEVSPQTAEKLLQLSKNDLSAVRATFDPAYYRAMNEDLSGSDEDLLAHYMTEGWREGRDPNSDFSTHYYLETYPDIAANGSNPFLHYILYGRNEGRRPRGDGPVRLINTPKASITPPWMASVLRQPPKLMPLPKPPRSSDAGKLKLHWIVPDFSRGSGGHMTIFRMIRHLESLGHECHIWIEMPIIHKTAQEAWETIVKHFQCVQASVDFVGLGFFRAKGDAVIATGWTTAYLANRATGFAEKFYFVQDHEPEFYPTGSENLLARETYDFDLSCICASPWLEQLMQERYGRWARSFHLAYDHEIYKIAKPEAGTAKNGPCKIAVYARDHTARRCVTLTLAALRLLGKQRQDFEVHFFGQDKLPFSEVNYPALNHGILTSEELADLYNACDIGICFSATNYSLVPQEMMACGLPLVELDVESTRAVFDEAAVTFAGPDPRDIAAKIERLIQDPTRRSAQTQAALEWVGQFSWHGAADKVEAVIKERLSERRTLTAPATHTASHAALDVVIPTYNGLGEIEPVIEALRSQRNSDEIQIHCIDSSSSDGTTEWLKAQADISTTVIDQKDFQHGRTRNEGAALGQAPIIAFLTQDATPVNAAWGPDILRMFGHNPKAAGLFGRHEPYPHHPEHVRDEITQHFANMQAHPLALSKYTNAAKWASGDIGWRQLLHYYSDNNSAMRRDVWKRIPYPEVDYGEDQIWARDIIAAGHTKLYAPTVCVYHSHDYTPDETYKRSKIEGAFFYEHFGYKLGANNDAEMNKRIKADQSNFKAWAKKRSMSGGELEKALGNIVAKHRGLREGMVSVQ